MTNDERAQIRATGATSAHVGMTEAEQERARVWWRRIEWRTLWEAGLIGCALWAVISHDTELVAFAAVMLAISALERIDHLKGVE